MINPTGKYSGLSVGSFGCRDYLGLGVEVTKWVVETRNIWNTKIRYFSNRALETEIW